jgi:hypothetical protein
MLVFRVQKENSAPNQEWAVSATTEHLTAIPASTVRAVRESEILILTKMDLVQLESIARTQTVFTVRWTARLVLTIRRLTREIKKQAVCPAKADMFVIHQDLLRQKLSVLPVCTARVINTQLLEACVPNITCVQKELLIRFRVLLDSTRIQRALTAVFLVLLENIANQSQQISFQEIFSRSRSKSAQLSITVHQKQLSQSNVLLAHTL